MAAALVNQTTGTGTSGTAFTIPATTAGNLILVGVTGDTNRTISSISDGTNTYTTDKANPGTNTQAAIASTIDSVGGKTSITVTMSGTENIHVDILEFSGILASSYVGLSSNGSAASGTAVAVTSYSPTVGNLIVATGGAGGARIWTKDAAYSKGSTDTGSVRGLTEYLLSSSGTETSPMSLNTSAAWTEVSVEYKLAPTGIPNKIVQLSQAVNRGSTY